MKKILFTTPLKTLLASAWAWGLLLGVGQSACAQDAPKEPTKLNLVITAAAAVNPDTTQRPSPIKVRVYELKDSNSFTEADYFTLDTSDKVTLGADMLAKDEFILRPGESRTIERKSKAQTTAIGVLAGYRDLGNSNWRAVHALKEAPEASWMRTFMPSNRAELSIELQAQGVVVTEKP